MLYDLYVYPTCRLHIAWPGFLECHLSLEAEMDAAAERVREFQTVPGIRRLSCLVNCHIHANHFDIVFWSTNIWLIDLIDFETPEVLS